MAKDKGIAIGIDLGTSYSCVAVWQEQHNRVEIIHNDQGNRTTPSFVAFTYDQRLIGEAAKNQAATNPENTVFDANGTLSVSAEDPSAGYRNEISITNDQNRLSAVEIKRMIHEAQNYQAEDRNFMKKANAMNALHDFVYKMNNALKNSNISSKLCPQDREKINSAVKNAAKLLDEDNQQHGIELIEDNLNELMDLFDRVISGFV